MTDYKAQEGLVIALATEVAEARSEAIREGKSPDDDDRCVDLMITFQRAQLELLKLKMTGST
jgi:hypothetical protein